MGILVSLFPKQHSNTINIYFICIVHYEQVTHGHVLHADTILLYRSGLIILIYGTYEKFCISKEYYTSYIS